MDSKDFSTRTFDDAQIGSVENDRQEITFSSDQGESLKLWLRPNVLTKLQSGKSNASTDKSSMGGNTSSETNRNR